MFFLNTGCYLTTQGIALLRLQLQARSISSILAEQNRAPEILQFLEETQKIRSFAAEHLNVSGTKNYTTFVETDKKYLAAIVSASEEFSCDPFLWHFPIVGSVPYKGFFAVEKAVKEA